MKIRLVFDEWRHKANYGLAGPEKGVELSAGDFHSGSTFEATIEQLDSDTANELEGARCSPRRGDAAVSDTDDLAMRAAREMLALKALAEWLAKNPVKEE